MAEESIDAARVARRGLSGVVLGVAILAPALGGCSLTFPLGPFGEPELTTGSIVPSAVLSDAATGEDLVIAAGALDQALDPVRKGAPARWANPATGSQGSFVAEGEAFVRQDQVCRSFKAALTVQKKADDLRGLACRTGAGSWTIQKLKPLRDPEAAPA